MSKRTGGYDTFYEHYVPFVTAFVRRRVPAADVDDVAADVFAIAWRRRHEVPENALPWLYRTARNVIGTRYRSTARLAALHEKLRATPIESVGDPAEVTASRDRLFAAFAQLTESDRELLLLVTWEGLTNEDAAEVLGVSMSACAVRVHRARSRFETALSKGEYTSEQTSETASAEADISVAESSRGTCQ